MSFERFSIKKIYYYTICAVTLFILLWGAVDATSSVLSLTLFKSPSINSLDMPSVGQGAESKDAAAQAFGDEYYQSRMTMDRLQDSIARLLVAGCVFLYASFRIREIESKEI